MLSLPHLVFCGVLAVAFSGVHGLSDEEKAAIHTLVRPFIQDCGKEYDVSEADIKTAEETKTFSEMNPCLISCVLKKMGLLNAEGMFDEAKATELATKFVPDEDEQKKALDIIQTCSSVNEQSVSDGEAGCERAKGLLECYMSHKGQIPGTS